MHTIIHSPHDRFFRSSMAYPQVAEQFFETYLPESIRQIADLTTLELRKDTYISKELQLSTTDMLFAVNIHGKPGYFYLLVEHKSQSERLTPFQLLKYTTRIMEQHLKEQDGEELPLIYPLILYNGKDTYRHSTDLFSLFNDQETLARDVFLKPFQLIDLTQISDKEVREKAWLSVMLLCLKHVCDREDALRWIAPMLDNMRIVEQEGGFEYAQSSFLYLFEEGEVTDVKGLQILIHNRLSPDLEKNAMNIAQQFKAEGRQEGIQQGIEEGKALMRNIAQQFKAEGRQEGIQQGIEEEKALMTVKALELIQQGLLSIEAAQRLTDLSEEVITTLLKKNNH